MILPRKVGCYVAFLSNTLDYFGHRILIYKALQTLCAYVLKKN